MVNMPAAVRWTSLGALSAGGRARSSTNGTAAAMPSSQISGSFQFGHQRLGAATALAGASAVRGADAATSSAMTPISADQKIRSSRQLPPSHGSTNGIVNAGPAVAPDTMPLV